MAIRRHYELQQRRQLAKRQRRRRERSTDNFEQHQRISWRYIWRTYALLLANGDDDDDGVRLDDSNRKLSEYGVRNKSQLKFVKRHLNRSRRRRKDNK